MNGVIIVLAWISYVSTIQIQELESNVEKLPIVTNQLSTTDQVLNHPLVAAALQKISQDAIATVTSVIQHIKEEKSVKKDDLEIQNTLKSVAKLRKKTEHRMPMLGENASSPPTDDTNDNSSASGSGDDLPEILPKKISKKIQMRLKKTEEKIRKLEKNKTEIHPPHNHHHQHKHHHHHHHHHHQKDLAKKSVKPKLNNSEVEKHINGPQSKNLTEKIAKMKNRSSIYSIPQEIPSSCRKLVKSYANGEMTLRDYLKELGKCKRNEVALKKEEALAKTPPEQREAIATQETMNQEAYNYALKELTGTGRRTNQKETANAVLDKWRANSFGEKKESDPEKVPDAVKKFMTVQSNLKSKHASIKKGVIDLKSIKPDPLESAKSIILNHITGRSDGSLFGSTATGVSSIELPEETSEEADKKSNIPTNTQVLSKQMKELIENSGAKITTSLPSNIMNSKSTNPNVNGDMNLENLKSIAKQNEISRSNVMKPDIINTVNDIKKESILKTAIPDNSIISQVNTEISLPQNHLMEQSTLNKQLAVSNAQGNTLQPLIQPITASTIFSNKLLQNEKSPILNENELAAERVLASFANPVLNKLPVDTSLVAALSAMSRQQNSIETNNKDDLLPMGFSKRQVFENRQRKRHIAESLVLHKPRKREVTDTIFHFSKTVRPNFKGMRNNVSKYKRKRSTNEDIKLDDNFKEAHITKSSKSKVKGKRSIKIQNNNNVKIKNKSKFEKLIKRDTKEFKSSHNPIDSIFKSDNQHLKEQEGKFYGKRDANDKVKSAKAIERSKMSLPLTSSQQGPKLMDKIRDMSRVIATP